MKKVFILPLFVMVALVSLATAQTTGQHCTEGGQLAFCQWGTGCFTVNNMYSPNVGAECSALLAACKKDGILYTGASVPTAIANSPYGEGANCAAEGLTKAAGGNEDCGYYCLWTSGCEKLSTDVNADYHDDPIMTCSEAIAQCDKDGQRFSNSSCTGTQIGGEEPCGYYCQWTTGCEEIKTDKAGSYHDSPVNTCGEAIAACDKDGERFTNSSCTTPAPILSIPKAQGLTVIPNGRSLHILSVRDASVSLYDLAGNRVFSSKVSKGNNTVSLTQKQGVYYAVVTSGAQTQTVKVMLK